MRREANLGVESIIEVYAPVIAAGEVVGAYEIYADATPLEASIAGRKQVIWLTTAGVFFALWGLLVLLVRRASDTLRRQTTTLRERSVALANAYEALERNALEAVESLNATVEAKDPYTAGHSLRVQRIALAMGDELGFTPIEMDALRFGALFHDIGKIAIPDGILTKPGRLTAEEYEDIKRHSAEGARIIEKFSRLREAVPIVRHHHERWDGKGYPDGLVDGRDPGRRCNRRARRCVGRHDDRSPVPGGADDRCRDARGAQRPRHAVHPGRRRRILRGCEQTT